MRNGRCAIALALLAGVLLAVPTSAANIEGTVQSVDSMRSQISLDNGSQVAVDDSTRIITMDGKEGRLEDLKPGAKVKASYEEKDGKNIASTVEVTETP